jgi:hypothetical protein
VLYPNPAQNSIFINGIIDQNSSYEIYDNIGQMVANGALNNEINIAHLSSGFYFIKISNSDSKMGVSTFEIIK